MPVRYIITHWMTFQFPDSLALCHGLVHLMPRTTGRQRCSRHRLQIQPNPESNCPGKDCFGNPTTFFTVRERCRELSVAARQVVEVAGQPTAEPDGSPPWELVAAELRSTDSAARFEAAPFLWDSVHSNRCPLLADYARVSFRPGAPLLAGAVDLALRVGRDAGSPATAFATADGCGRASPAHAAIACLRSIGLAARYVSGYRPGRKGADAEHAWLSVFCPRSGWHDLDPSSADGWAAASVTRAWGRDADDVRPVKGVPFRNAGCRFAAEIEVLAPRRAGLPNAAL